MLLEFLTASTSYFNFLDLLTDIMFLSLTVWPLESDVSGVFFVSSLLNLLLWVSNIIYTEILLIFNIKLISFAVLNTAFKFIILIALLIFVRGGIPRYRYDFLTKVGWIKFLSLILSIFLSTLLLLFLF